MSSNLDWNRRMWSDKDKWEGLWDGGYFWGGEGVVRTDFERFVAPYIRHLSRPNVLEIACGMGRFTRPLLEVAGHVHAIDLQALCVERCLDLFRDRDTFSASVTDGKTLPEGRYDLIASYDSLVHADYEVLSTYLRQAALYLTPRGILAIHHANRPDKVRSRFAVTGEMVKEFLERELPDLRLLAQTLFKYEKGRFIDCFTVAMKSSALYDEQPRLRSVHLFGKVVAMEYRYFNDSCEVASSPSESVSRIRTNGDGEPSPECRFRAVELAGGSRIRTTVIASGAADGEGTEICLRLVRDDEVLAEVIASAMPGTALPLALELPQGVDRADVHLRVGPSVRAANREVATVSLEPIRLD